jgi:uncharacterized protein (DUF2147 family)
MRPALTLALILILAGPTGAAAADGDAILGLWATEPGGRGGQAHVEITRDGAGYSGRIVWLEEPNYPADDPSGLGGQPKTDLENPDPDLQDRPIIGLTIVEGFQAAGPAKWVDGTIYDPENGTTYSCKAKLKGDVLRVRGYIGVSLLGRTTEWTRVEAGR